jgi:hypothetical protein
MSDLGFPRMCRMFAPRASVVRESHRRPHLIVRSGNNASNVLRSILSQQFVMVARQFHSAAVRILTFP